RKRLMTNREGENSIVRGELLREAFQIELHVLGNRRLPLAAKLFHIGNDHRVKALALGLGHAQHADFLDPWTLSVVRFELLRINILAIRQDDHILASSRNDKAAVGLQTSEITRVVPAIDNRRPRRALIL